MSSLSAGTRLGPYEVVACVGIGGMGEVYRAHDARLGRSVAIKTLPPRSTDDPALRKRFAREARAISSLSHPRICSLYDIGHEEGRDFLVMEYLEGETLAQRLSRGRLPKAEALRIAAEIAEALEHAHKRGIVHRDLKPGNVMLTATGAKLLDFGLARLTGGLGEQSASEPLTVDGMLLGTVDYMSPEQLNGEPVDARSDIFAFGVILYEMLTGVRPFTGETRASIIGAILCATPRSAAEIDPDIEPAVDGLIAACLEKKADDRVQSVHDLRLQLQWLQGERPRSASFRSRKAAVRSRLRLGAAAVVLIAGASAATYFLATPRPAARQIRFTIATPQAGAEIQSAAVSPDGLLLALATQAADGKRALWLRAIDDTTFVPVPGSDGAADPFWSPDSRQVAFFAAGKLHAVAVTGEKRTRELCRAAAPRGGSWGSNGSIVFAADGGSSLYAVAERGGVARRIRNVDARAGDKTLSRPSFLPDGRHFLFTLGARDAARRGVYLASLDRPAGAKVAGIERAAVAAGDRVVHVTDGSLQVQRFSADGALQGQPVILERDLGAGKVTLSASVNGVVLYRLSPPVVSELTWFTEEGDRIDEFVPPGDFTYGVIASDMQRVALVRDDDDRSSVSILDKWNGGETALSDRTNTLAPVWSVDGTAIFFAAQTGPSWELRERVTTSAQERVLLRSERPVRPTSACRGMLALESGDRWGSTEISLLPLAGGAPQPLRSAPPNAREPSLEQDCTTIAYVTASPEGRRSLYVQPLTGSATPRLIASDAHQPFWSPDGSHLYYVRGDMQVVSVTLDEAGKASERQLFRIPALPRPAVERVATIAHGGKAFAVNSPAAGAGGTVTAIVNWSAERSGALPRQASNSTSTPVYAITTLQTPSGAVRGVSSVAYDAHDNLYVGDPVARRLIRLTADRRVEELGSFHFPHGIAFDAKSNIYVSDFGRNAIYKIAPAGKPRLFAGVAGRAGSADGPADEAMFHGPEGLAVDSGGNLFVADHFNSTIRKISPEGAVTTFAGKAGDKAVVDGVGAAARFDSPAGLTIDRFDDLYVTDHRSHTVRRVSPSGLVTTVAGRAHQDGWRDGQGGDVRFSLPNGIVYDSANDVFLVDEYTNATLRLLTRDGKVKTVAGRPKAYGFVDGEGATARFHGMGFLAVDRWGRVVIGDILNKALRVGRRVWRSG